jgi:DNA-binding NarL/FixJ family response regulator
MTWNVGIFLYCIIGAANNLNHLQQARAKLSDLGLTVKQSQVLGLRADGACVEHIAAWLGVTAKAVEALIARGQQKLKQAGYRLRKPSRAATLNRHRRMLRLPTDA